MLRGRTSETDRFEQALPRALASERQAFALVGEPGIGKTTLATELAGLAAARGMAVAWGRAWEAGGQGPLWLWRQLFEGLGAGPTGPLAGLWGTAGAGEFASTDPGATQRRLFEATAHEMLVRSRVQPLLCVLDDLHAADAASLELLHFVLRAVPRGALIFLLTWRDAEAERGATRELLARVMREAIVLPLTGLSAEDSQQLLVERLGPLDAQVSRDLYRATSGNPLFLIELAQSAALRGGAATLAGLGQLPVTQGVATLVADRASLLSTAERTAVEAFSVVGRELDDAALADACAEPPHRASELAASLATAGFLRRRGATWFFSHALVRDALYASLPADRRCALHLRYARALNARLGRGESGLEGARAHHGLSALPDAPSAEIGQWALAAAAQARAQCAFDDAVSVLERARRSLAGDAAVEGELLVALGWVHGDAGRTLSMRETLLAAMHLARQRSDPHLLARAVLGYGARYLLGSLRADLLTLLDEADAALGSERSSLHARIAARRAAAMTPAIDSERTLAMARAAVAEIEHEPDRRALIDVAVAAGSAMGDHAPARERAALNTRLVAAARAEQEPLLELRGLARLVTDHLEAGDLSLADVSLMEWNALNARVGHPSFVWMGPLFESMRAAAQGRFVEARAAVDAAAALAMSAGSENAQQPLVLHRHWLYLLEDDLPALQGNLPRVLSAISTEVPAIALLARITVVSRLNDRPELERLMLGVPLSLPRLQATTSVAALGEAIAPLGTTAHVRVLRARLEQRLESNVTWGLFAFSWGVPVAAVTGLLAGVEGETERAFAHFTQALARATRLGTAAHLAWVHRWFARTLAAAPGQAALAKEHHEKALELAQRLQMSSFGARLAAEAVAAGLLARAGTAAPAAVPAPPDVPAPLAVPAPSAAHAQPAAFDAALRREAEGWRITHGERSFYLRDVRGIGMLAKLLERPNEELHALELATDGAGSEAWDAGDAGELLDDAARTAYRKHAQALSAQLDDAKEKGDAAAAERAEEELEALGRELSRAQGLGGRKRRAGVAAERARVVVQRRLREAIRKIAQHDAELGAQLDRAVRTGTFCVFRPLSAVTTKR